MQRRPRRLLLVAATLVLGLATAAPVSASLKLVWRGNYNTGNFSQWMKVPLEGPVARRIVTNPVRDGRYAAKFRASPSGAPTRTELQADRGYYGAEEWYVFSEYVPRRTVFSRNFNHLVQWHPWYDDCYGGSLAVNGRARPNRLYARFRGGAITSWGSGCSFQYDRTFRLGALRRGRWLDFRMHVIWSGLPKVGFVEIWLNGRRVAGPVHLATTDTGRNIHMRQGLFRYGCNCRTVVFGDRFKKYVRVR